MVSVKGIFKGGVAQPIESVEGRNGQPVIITFLDEESASLLPPAAETAWEALVKLVDDCAVQTGVTDLAHEHDHYLYGKPKRE